MYRSTSNPVFARDWWFKQYGDHVESLINKRSNEAASWRQKSRNVESEVRTLREELLTARHELSQCQILNEAQAEELRAKTVELEDLQKQFQEQEVKLKNAPKLPAGADRDAVTALMLALESCKRELEEANLKHRREMQDLRHSLRSKLRQGEAASGGPSAVVSDKTMELADWEVRMQEIKEVHEKHVKELERQLSESHDTIKGKSEEMEELRVQNQQLFNELRRLRLVERQAEELEARLNNSGQSCGQPESHIIGPGMLPSSFDDGAYEDSLDNLTKTGIWNKGDHKGVGSLSVFRRDRRHLQLPEGGE